MTNTMEHIAKLVRENQHFIVTTHVQPDGDGIGSAVAMHLYLKKIGKTSHLVQPSPTPYKFQTVDPKKMIHCYEVGQPLPKADIIFVMDTNELKMLGPMEKPVTASGARVVYVDHHVPEMDKVADHLVDESYGATGELVFTFLRHMKADIDHEMALAIYVAIVTDTAGFRYKRTSHRSHEIAAELLKKGVLPEKVFRSVYAKDSFQKLKLLGHLLEKLETSENGRIAWLTIPKKTREAYGATVEDTESYVNQLTYVESVEIAILFREDEGGKVKISLRGQGETPVIGIAKAFGGGGHRHAAGARIQGSLEKVVKNVVEASKKALLDP